MSGFEADSGAPRGTVDLSHGGGGGVHHEGENKHRDRPLRSFVSVCQNELHEMLFQRRPDRTLPGPSITFRRVHVIDSGLQGCSSSGTHFALAAVVGLLLAEGPRFCQSPTIQRQRKGEAPLGGFGERAGERLPGRGNEARRELFFFFIAWTNPLSGQDRGLDELRLTGSAGGAGLPWLFLRGAGNGSLAARKQGTKKTFDTRTTPASIRVARLRNPGTPSQSRKPTCDKRGMIRRFRNPPIWRAVPSGHPIRNDRKSALVSAQECPSFPTSRSMRRGRIAASAFQVS